MTRSALVIAEAGVNHNGSLDMARELVDVAAGAGADIVKFQTFRAEKLATGGAAKAAYQQRTTGTSESQLDMLRKLQLSDEDHFVLQRHCAKSGIEFLSTPFDMESLDFLVGTLALPRLKLPSGEITNAPFLLAVAQTGKPVIVSTGMSTLDEVEQALGVLAFGYLQTGATPDVDAFVRARKSSYGQQVLREKVTLLHCTTEYPTPFVDVNLRAMATLRDTFGLSVGYSDHTQGIGIAIAAVALGAAVIEKHFTLDRNLPGPDHKASMEPGELKCMVESIRQVEQSLGNPVKAPVPSELKNREVVRKSLVTTAAIRRGEPFTPENITAKRPGTGVSPFCYWDLLGRSSPRDYSEDELVDI